MNDFDQIPTFTITAPEDTPPLTASELELAKQELIVQPFPVFNKRHSDNFIKKHDPQFALFSFIPNSNTSLCMFHKEIRSLLSKEQCTRLDEIMNNEKYIHGVGKIRGAYDTLSAAEKASDKIIQKIDSTNSVFICKIGEPFPLVIRGFAEEVKKIDVKNIVETSVIENIRRKRDREQKEIEEIRRREQQLQQPVEPSPHVSELDNYITMKVGLAHTRYEMDKLKKLEGELFVKLVKFVSKLLKIEEENPDFVKEYMDRYMEGRKSVGFNANDTLEGYLAYIKKPTLES
jgi:hypothetical protein